MASPVKKPLLAPGNETEWAKINEEEARQEAEFAAGLSMAERVAYGQKLSQQAVALLVASVKAGHAPRRALCQDRLDLENLERVNGKLPEDEIPGLDD